MVNFVIVKTLNFRNGKIPIHLRPLPVLLNDLGVEKTIKTNSGYRQLGRKATFHFLWEKFEAARKFYFQRIRELHPDRGGDWKLCAELNSIWKQIKLLFARRGIGLSVD
jgi:hypothetical protein